MADHLDGVAGLPGWFPALTPEEMRTMPRPPTARAGETAFASVVWQWWKEAPSSDQLARDSHEIAPNVR